MSLNTWGKWLKGILGVGSSIGLWSMTDTEVAENANFLIEHWEAVSVFLYGLVTSAQAAYKTWFKGKG